MGFGGKLVAHGLRSIASTALNEHGFNPSLIEKALSHEDKNAVRAAYNRAEYMDERREMMQWWSDQIERNQMAWRGNHIMGLKRFQKASELAYTAKTWTNNEVANAINERLQF